MVIAATNWTAVFVGSLTGATALAAAWLGYLGSRLASRTALAQSQTETAREREERLARERNERRTMYAAFLDVERSLIPALRAHQRAAYGPGNGVTERAALEEQFDAVSHALNGLVLGAPKDVAERAIQLHRLLNRLITEERQRLLRAKDVHRTFIRDLVSVWSPARRSLVDEMRADVSSDVAPIEWPPHEADAPSAENEDEEPGGEFDVGGGEEE